MMSQIRRTGLVMALVLVAFIALLLLPGRIAYAAPFVYTVTIAADDAGTAPDCATPANTDCSLRSAINASNGNAPGAGATNTINFAISTGPQTITLTAVLPDITAPVVINGTSQPDFAAAPIIEVRGESAGAGVNGLTLAASASGSTIEGLVIGGFGGAGIRITSNGANNAIIGNYLGTDATGTAAHANGGAGISIGSGATNNAVGGVTAGAGNLISGNSGSGVSIRGPNATGNTVAGNHIGTNAAGTAALANLIGVVIGSGATNNMVGGATAGAGNLISGNVQSGVAIVNDGTATNTVAGNLIGTNAAGTGALPNTDNGIFIGLGNAHDNTIGGTTAGARNVISGNSHDGLLVNTGATATIIQGNYIGVAVNGALALANGNIGVQIAAGDGGNTIGGMAAAARNVISGNGDSGIDISDTTLVEGNYVGTDVTGTMGIGNGRDGITIRGGAGTTIGGAAPGAGNLLSGNALSGIALVGPTTNSNTTIAGNRIGTTADGTDRIPNGTLGVYIQPPQFATTIGGTATGAGNLISGNAGGGIYTSGTGVVAIEGNLIGTKADGAAALANGFGNTFGVGFGGVIIDSGAVNTTVGDPAGAGMTPGARNVISGNSGAGVTIQGPGTTGNKVGGNYIGTNAAGSGAVPNDTGITIRQGATNTRIGAASGQDNIIAFNRHEGVLVTDSGTTGNIITLNSIHDNGALGIDLGGDGVTPNDPGDGDTGPNNLQNYPVLTTATRDPFGYIDITGTLNAAPNTMYFLYAFANAAADPSGHGEGQTLMSSGSVTTDGSGKATLSGGFLAVAGQDIISVTVTNATTDDTSEFSNDVTVTAAPSTTTAANQSVPDIVAGHPVTLSAIISDPNYYPVNEGVVTFAVKNGNTPIGSPVTSGAVTHNYVSVDYTLPGGTAPGVYTITATYHDAAGVFADSSDTTHTLTVTPGAAASFAVTGYPSPTMAGTSHTFTVTVTDSSANTITAYTGTIHFTSTDTQAALPTDYPFQASDNGSHTFTATLKTSGTQSLTAIDTTAPSLTGTQAAITVTPGPATAITATAGSGQHATVGTSFATNLQALVADTFGNPVGGATVTFSAPSSGASGVFAGGAPTTVMTTASGIATAPTFTANGTAGTYTVTATVAGASGPALFTLMNTASPLVTLSPATLPAGAKGVAYSQTFAATGGTTPYTFTTTGGTLPPGLTLDSGGSLSGTPTASGDFTFTVQATDAGNATGRQSYTLTIAPAPAQSVAVACGALAASLKVGETLQCAATVTYADGTTRTDAAVQWETSDATRATTDSTGKIKGVAPGQVRITASFAGKQGQAQVTVASPTLIGVQPPVGRPSGASAVGGGTALPAPTGRSNNGGGTSAPTPVPATR